jgi:hypothetical protein
MALTVQDLEATLEDERHLGYGYACSRDLSPSKATRLDRAVIAVANELDLDQEDLFEWSNSKHGRWLTDRIYGRNASISRATVRLEMSEKIIDDLRKGL